MLTRIICFVLFAVLVGGVFGQDSLNVRHHWSMPHTGRTMVMDSDTNIWFVEPGTDNLVKVDVSNVSDTSTINTYFYDMDSVMWEVVGIVNDTMLLAGYVNLYTINIAANPPQLISTYTSSHYRGLPVFLRDSLMVTMDRENRDSCIALFNISDPTNIDTYATNIGATVYSGIPPATGAYMISFSAKDSALYLCYCVDYSLYDPYHPWPSIYVSVINIADYRNPVFDTTYRYSYSDADYPELPAPSVVVDSFLYIATNNFNNYDAIVLNISNPINPVGEGVVGSSWQEKKAIAYQNGYLYVGARIYNISSSPTGDSLVGYYSVPGISFGGWYQIPFNNYIFCLTPWFTVLDFYEYSQVYEPNNRLPETEPDIYLTPNPSIKYSNLNIPNPLDGTMEIYDIRGQRIEQFEISRQNTTYTIDLTEYSTGLYLVTYNFGNKRVVKKLLVLG